MIRTPSRDIKKYKKLAIIIEKGKYKPNPTKHQKFLYEAKIKYEKASNPKNTIAERRKLLIRAWDDCFNSIKFQADDPAGWILYGDINLDLGSYWHIALETYNKALELNPPEKELVLQKIKDAKSIIVIFRVLLEGKISLENRLTLLECFSCRSTGSLDFYNFSSHYRVNTGAVVYKGVSYLTLPICEKCVANADKNIKKHLIKSIRGYEIDGGLHIPITYNTWEELVIMDRFRKGELPLDHLFSSLKQ